MESIHPETKALFDTYKELINSPNLECNMYYEALIFEATRMGLTPEKLRIVFLARKKAVREGKPAKGTFIRHLFGTEATGDVLDEAANLEGMSRVRIADPARTSVLRATSRPETTGTDKPAQSATDVIERLKTGYTEVRKAIGE